MRQLAREWALAVQEAQRIGTAATAQFDPADRPPPRIEFATRSGRERTRRNDDRSKDYNHNHNDDSGSDSSSSDEDEISGQDAHWRARERARRRGTKIRHPFANRRPVFPPFHADLYPPPGDEWAESQIYRAEIILDGQPYDVEDVMEVAGLKDRSGSLPWY